MDFTIVTAVTQEYLAQLYWNMGSWSYKSQFKNRPLIIYYNGILERKLHFARKLFSDVRFIPWAMEGVENKSELMFSAFVFGAVRDVKTPYYMKLDADAYITNNLDIWDETDFAHDLVGHKWHYTKPGWYIQKLDNIYNKTDSPVDLNLRHWKHRRIESYCCLHKTEWVRSIAEKFNGRLPVPSHDTSLWYYANKEGKWLGKNLKAAGVDNARNWKISREIACSGNTAFNQILNEELLSHVQLEITHKCNIGCFQCDRNCGVLPAVQDMQIDQVWKFIEESLAAGKQWGRIDIIGGEPTLHNKLKTILAILEVYKSRYPKTKIRFSTNGLGDKVQENLKILPEWILVRNSEKEGREQPHTVFHDSPVDHGITSTKACSVPWRCGLGLTSHGYFPCGAGAAVARAFNLDIGIKELRDVTPENIKKQLLKLCKYCGHSNSIEQLPAVNNEMSESWKNAVQAYAPETMSCY